MTKEQYYTKYGITDSFIKADLEAVIANEIAKVKEPKPELNPIEQAYERGEKIRVKDWFKGSWVKKNSDNSAVDEKGNLWYFQKWSFYTKSEDWELYTEPTEQPSSQVKLDNSFDRDRFEAMFCSMVAREPHWTYKDCIIETEKLLKQLNAYYVSKEGGENE